jgi:pre-peptidase
MSLHRGSAVTLAVGLALGAALAAPARAQQQIPIGSAVTGQLTAADPVLSDNTHYKLFTFQGDAGQTVQIDLISNDFDSYLYLRDANGASIATNDDGGGGLNARIIQTLPATAMYQIVANTLRQGQYGSFTLRLQAVATPTVAAQQIPVGSTVNGVLTDGDPTLNDGSHYKLFTFQGFAGQAVQIDLMSTAFDAYLYLRDSSGHDIAHDDDSGGNLNSRIIQTLPYSGTFQIVANTLHAGASGPFTLELQSAQAQQATVTSIQPLPSAAALPTVGQIGLNQQVQNTLMQGGTSWNGKPIHLYTFGCTAGQAFQMDILSSWDNYAIIFDPSGNQVASNDDGGQGLNARIAFTCPTTGAYRLGVTTFSASTATGAYTMQVQALGQQAPVQAQPIGQPAVTPLPQPTVTPIAPTVTPIAPTVTPIAPTTVAPIAQAAAAVQPTNPVPAPGQIGQIAAGQTMRGRLEPGDQMMGSDSTYADIWQLQGSAGQNVAIELRSDDFDTYLQLLDGTGKVLAESAGHPNSGLAFQLPAAGTYQIVVNNNGTQRRTGDYTLSVR